MSEFKVGDKVRFKPFQAEWRNQEPYYTRRMKEIAEELKQARISRVLPSGEIELDGTFWYTWSPEWFLPNKTRVFK